MSDMKKCWVYALKSKKDGHLYIGLSYNAWERLKNHNAGEVKSTKSRRPFKIIYLKQFDDRKTARQHEKKLKTGSGREFLKSLSGK